MWKEWTNERMSKQLLSVSIYEIDLFSIQLFSSYSCISCCYCYCWGCPAVAGCISLLEHLYTFEKHRLKANIYVGIISYILNEGFIVLGLIIFAGRRRKNEWMNEREEDRKATIWNSVENLVTNEWMSERANKKRTADTYTENVVVIETINKMMRIKINCTQCGWTNPYYCIINNLYFA